MSLELEPLNVLIGPNASGKSNLIEAISLLEAAPRNLLTPFREGGGVVEWLWKGHESSGEAASLTVDFQGLETLFRYNLEFTAEDLKFRLLAEGIGYLPHDRNPPSPDFKPVYSYTGGHRSAYRRRDEKTGISELVRQENVSSEQSVLSQSRGPAYPDLTYISAHFERFAFFRDLSLGRSTSLRKPQAADLPGDFLLEDASNLALVLNDLQHRPATKRLLLEKLKLFYAGVEDVTTKVQGGTIQVFLHEEGLSTPIPATRLSDGTLRYLCLLAILCHPEPPPLICIEEPELGLHPDILPTIADLLVDAAQRTQLIVTTHSEALVSKLSGIPEAVVVCEREPEGTRLRRLDPAQLQDWLEKYQLGQLWSMGEIGGNRW